MPRKIQTGEYAIGGGRVGLSAVSSAILLKDGDTYKYTAGKEEFICIISKAQAGSIFGDGAKVGDIFPIASGLVADKTLANGDSAYKMEIKTSDPVVTASISQTAETTDVRTQIEEGRTKQIPTGNLTTEINLSLFPQKGNLATDLLTNNNIRVISSDKDGTLAFADAKEVEMLLVLYSMYGQDDQDVGVAAIVRPNANPFAFSATDTAAIEFGCSLSEKSNLTKFKVAKQ